MPSLVTRATDQFSLQPEVRSLLATGSRVWGPAAVWLVVLCSLLQAEPSGQTPISSPSSVHFYVCPSGELSQPDRAVLATLNDDLSAAITRGGGVVFAPTPRGGGAAPQAAGCATVEEVVSALQKYGSAPSKQAVFVLLDSPALGNLLRRQADLVRNLGLRVMNLRLFTRPLHIFENEEASKQNPKAPNVGVYADQEIAASTLTPLLATVLERPVRAVPFQNIAEMARCLAQGQFAASSSQCPAQIAWAAIVEQDASLTVETFERAYREGAKRAPKPFAPAGLQLGIHVSAAGPGVEVIVAPSANIPALRSTVPSSPAGMSMAAVPRTNGPVLVEQQARENPPEPAGFLATLWARLPSVGTQALAASVDADSALLRHPYPIVLTNQDPTDNPLRGALSDSYLRVLNNSAIGSPCSAVAERLHRAYLFNAHLDDPSNASKRLSLGSELVLATGGARSLAELFSRLQLNPDLRQWPQDLAPAAGPPPACPSMPNERFPEDRLFFANANLAFQHRAVEHLRRGNLDGAAACLRKALAESATPNCHKAERSTYSIYYNPYFYFAVQQVTGGRAPR
jgi:hypothetical protein